MSALAQLRRLWTHATWADETVLAAIRKTAPGPSAGAAREFAHIIGAEETWLARLEGRDATLAVWPELSRNDLPQTTKRVHAAFSTYLAQLTEADLDRTIAYKNTLGRSFESRIGDVLAHVMLHGHYHRGKVNLLLRNANAAPAPADYIAFVRGVPAAVAPKR